ncbi:MAG TPA: OmpA family protein [Bryobacteraceae bacterium]|nr:OmpA family protein [Bryobacteraceae bacterium]
MKAPILPTTVSFVFLSAPTWLAVAQQPLPHEPNAPIYRVTVVERTVKAINYQYLSGPTKIDLRGTVLLPYAKGEATVESRPGRTEIEATFDGLSGPQRFGGEYLTYVLWAITPEGRPHNIGELIAGSSDKAKVRVTTDLQAFALIVTAEPYSAVRQPSDLVVLENQVRQDTAGTIKPVEARYELLPRGEYTWAPGNYDPKAANSPKVSMHEYQALTEIYQAQNAVNIASSAQAERYAPDTLARAQQLLAEAQQVHDRKGDFRRVVESAREAAQTAEDARVIAQERQRAEQIATAGLELSRTRAQVSQAQQEKDQALQETQRAQAQADAARAQADAALAARNRAESEAAAARERALAPPPPIGANNPKAGGDQQAETVRKRDLRMRLFRDLNGVLPTLDTGRGLVATVPDDGFRGGDVGDAYSYQVKRIAGILAAHSGLRVSVEGYSDVPAKEALSHERAVSVRLVLIGNGVAPVSAAGYGDRRPLGSNATPQGRKENSRVEIVITGESIGELPLWERPYALSGSAQNPYR